MDGSSIPLLPDHTEELSTAVAELLQRKAIAAPKQTVAADFLKRCESAAQMMAAFSGRLEPEEKLALAEVLARMRKTAAGMGVQIISW
jgi:hypothetical protein